MESGMKRGRGRRSENTNADPACKRLCSSSRKGTQNRIAAWIEGQKPISTADRTPSKTGIKLAEDLRASAVKRIHSATQTPLKLKQTTAKLPASHALLVEMYGKLQTVYMLYRRRNQQCTFHNARRPVEECCGRNFTMNHLLQIKAALPDALALSSSTTGLPNPIGSSSKADFQVFIEMPQLAGNSSQASAQEMRQELADRLTDAVMTHHKSAHPACDPDADPSTCGFDIESCPELPAADKVLPAYLYWSPAAASPPAKAPCTPATSHPRPTPLSSSRKPPTAPRTGRPMAKRLSFGGPGELGKSAEAAQSSEGGIRLDGISEEACPGMKEAQLARELRRQSMDGSIPVSLQALQAVRQTSEEQAAMFNEDAVAARREATAMTLLPKMFDSVRAVFGSSGPTVMSTQKVISKLSGGKGEQQQQSELAFQLHRLAESVPEYVKLETRPEQGEVLRIDRSLDPKLLRDKLAALSKTAYC